MERYDSIIIGAGHNGLVCAAYLARGGQRVLVLEASDIAGGLAAAREFHPGFHATVAQSISHFSAKIASDLNIEPRALGATSNALPTIGLSKDRAHVTVHQGSVIGASSADARAYKDYAQLMHRFADVLKPFWLKKMPRIGSTSIADLLTFAHVGLNIRRIGKKDMQEFLRVASLPARDLMDEYFDSDILKAMLSWDGLVGAKLAPRSPNSAVLAILYRMAEESRGAHTIPVGGVKGLMETLCLSAEASGAEIRCASPVSRILTDSNDDGLFVKGVQLGSGEQIHADRVVSAADPRTTFLDLVGVENLDIGFTNRIRRLRCDGYVAKLHLALNAMPDFEGLDSSDARMIIAPELDAIEFAFDEAKYGDCPANPVMEVVVPSARDASCAPDGQHVLSANVMYVPYKKKGGWSEEARSQMCERAIDMIAQYAPRIRDMIVHREFLTPADLEREYHVTGGHWHHTEFAMDQLLMMRPTYGAAQYNTPILGLFLCGAGSHPAGDITGAPGHNAAREILR